MQYLRDRAMTKTTQRIELVLLAHQPDAVQQFLEGYGHRVLAIDECANALSVLQAHRFDVLLIDMNCSDQPRFLQQLRDRDPNIQAIVLYNEPQNGPFISECGGAGEATMVPAAGAPAASLNAINRVGATTYDQPEISGVDYVPKPLPFRVLEQLVRKSARITRLSREIAQLRQMLQRTPSLQTSLGAVSGETFPTIAPQYAGPTILEGTLDDIPVVGGNADLDTINRAHVLTVLQQNQGNKARTARALGINRRSLYRLLEKYGMPASLATRESPASTAS
jgi:ActR/RegA family two-component response regulator